MDPKSQIRQYYDSNQIFYRTFYYNEISLGMHFGFWDKKTKDIHEAILNVNREVIRLAKITAG